MSNEEKRWYPTHQEHVELVLSVMKSKPLTPSLAEKVAAAGIDWAEVSERLRRDPHFGKFEFTPEFTIIHALQQFRN